MLDDLEEKLEMGYNLTKTSRRKCVPSAFVLLFVTRLILYARLQLVPRNLIDCLTGEAPEYDILRRG